jgi:hypothetical protein
MARLPVGSSCAHPQTSLGFSQIPSSLLHKTFNNSKHFPGTLRDMGVPGASLQARTSRHEIWTLSGSACPLQGLGPVHNHFTPAAESPFAQGKEEGVRFGDSK